MTELAQMEIADTPADAFAGVDTLIATLRTAGADKFDPMRWHYIEVLAKRAAAQHASVKRMLDAKLAQALNTFQERFDQARSDATETVTLNAQQYPHAAKELQHHFDTGDFKELRRLIATLKSNEQCASLGALTRQLDQHTADNADTRVAINAEARPELKAIRNARNTWAKLSVDKQVAQALGQAPKNAGPINSHMLVLRSLALMRDISPDYLNRFMSYADTLLCLDQGEKDKVVKDKTVKDKPGNSKKPQVAKAAKK
jgi:hypothetical protein